jgi:hypothetical protein
MIKIYGIKCNITDMLYIGSTKNTLKHRLKQHKHDSKTRRNYMSRKIIDNNDYNIYVIEECPENIRKEREQYWIDNTNNINHNNVISNKKEMEKKYNEYYRNNVLDKEKKKEYMKKYKEFKKSWGGDSRFYNNLLLIDVNLFL